MDIFNGNRRLEELVMYGLDWGIFLRHNMEGGIAPFMYLQNGKDQKVRMLMTDGDPIEFAKSVLEKEDSPFEQFVIGFEGYLRDDKNQRNDAIIVQGFDITQPKGVSLGQMFNPMENGGFRKIDKTTFIDSPDLILNQKINQDADYSIEEIGFNAMAFADENKLTSYVVVLAGDNPTVIANTIKRFLRSKFNGAIKDELSGIININITDSKNEEFLTFLVTNSINEEVESEIIKNWQNQTKRTIEISCKVGEKTIYENKILNSKSISKPNESSKIISQDNSSNDETPKKWWEFWK
jgi:hypothetical protein